MTYYPSCGIHYLTFTDVPPELNLVGNWSIDGGEIKLIGEGSLSFDKYDPDYLDFDFTTGTTLDITTVIQGDTSNEATDTFDTFGSIDLDFVPRGASIVTIYFKPTSPTMVTRISELTLMANHCEEKVRSMRGGLSAGGEAEHRLEIITKLDLAEQIRYEPGFSSPNSIVYQHTIGEIKTGYGSSQSEPIPEAEKQPTWFKFNSDITIADKVELVMYGRGISNIKAYLGTGNVTLTTSGGDTFIDDVNLDADPLVLIHGLTGARDYTMASTSESVTIDVTDLFNDRTEKDFVEFVLSAFEQVGNTAEIRFNGINQTDPPTLKITQSVNRIDEETNGGFTVGGTAFHQITNSYVEEASGGLVMAGEWGSLISIEIESIGGLVAAGAFDTIHNEYHEIIGSGGLTFGESFETDYRFPIVVISTGGFEASGVCSFEIIPPTEMTGGFTLSGSSFKSVKGFDCINLIPINCKPKTNEQTTGGATIGGQTWHAIENRIDCLKQYLGLGDNENDLITNSENQSIGDLDIAAGIQCEPSERFNSNRYYKLDPIEYWNGFSMSCWMKFNDSIQEQTVFSISPVLRVGRSWQNEPLIDCDWIDSTSDKVWGSAIDNEWHLWTFNFKPNVEVAIYIDGEKSVELEQPKQFLNQSKANYFGLFKNGGYLNGNAQELRIYNKPRSISEIKGEYTAYNGLIEV